MQLSVNNRLTGLLWEAPGDIYSNLQQVFNMQRPYGLLHIKDNIDPYVVT